jgi:hypothetical protein
VEATPPGVDASQRKASESGRRLRELQSGHELHVVLDVQGLRPFQVVATDDRNRERHVDDGLRNFLGSDDDFVEVRGSTFSCAQTEFVPAWRLLRRPLRLL